MKFTQILAASSEIELLNWLEAQVIDVPPLVRDRTKKVMEHRAICLYLQHLHSTGDVQFPMIVIDRERPDYFLKKKGNSFGVEVTQAFLNNVLALEAIIENKDLEAFIDSSNFRTEDASKEKIRELSEATAITGTPYMGDAIEREWACEIMKCILHKSENSRSSGYKLFEENELLVLNHLPRQPGTESLCIKYLQKFVNLHGIEVFGRVSIFCGLFVFSVVGNEVSYISRER